MEYISTQLQNLRLHKVSMTVDKAQPQFSRDITAQKTGGQDGLIAVSSSLNNIQLFQQGALLRTNTLTGHDSLISSIGFLHGNPNLLFSSSEDKTVKICDSRVHVNKEIQRFTGAGDTNLRLLSCDVSLSDRVVCAGTEQSDSDAYILFWDRRKNDLLGCYKESHSDDVTQVHFHPTSEERLLSGSTDGLVNLYNIREMSEDDALVSTFNTVFTVERAGWCGPDARQVFCITHMFTWHTWDSETDEDLVIIKDFVEKLEGKCRADYIVDCIPAGSGNDMNLVVGHHSGDLHLLNVSDSEEVKVLRSLSGGHSDTVRCLHWDQQTETLLTGGEDSLLCMWSLASARKQTSKQGKTKEKRSSPRKRAAPYSKP